MSVDLKKISAKESWEIFDAASQRLLHLTGEEFAARWDSGAYAGDDDTRVMRVAMLRPGGR